MNPTEIPSLIVHGSGFSKKILSLNSIIYSLHSGRVTDLFISLQLNTLKDQLGWWYLQTGNCVLFLFERQQNPIV